MQVADFELVDGCGDTAHSWSLSDPSFSFQSGRLEFLTVRRSHDCAGRCASVKLPSFRYLKNLGQCFPKVISD